MSTEEPMSIEDRIRTATRAGATLVRDIGPMAAGPEKVRFRRRPAGACRAPLGFRGSRSRRRPPWPRVAVSLVAVRQFGGSAPATGGPATNGSATTVPRYYVVLDNVRKRNSMVATGTGNLIVGDDHADKVIATVTPPARRGVR